MFKNIMSFIDWIDRKVAYKKRIEKKVDEALSFLRDHDQRLLRLEILEAMKRNDAVTVCDLMKAYKERGGNYYMDKLFSDFMKKWKKKK